MVEVLALNYNRTQDQGLFWEGVSNDMVKLFPDNLKTVLPKISNALVVCI